MSNRLVELDIAGMTCSSCVSHVGKRLEAIPGVEASVNLATERATVQAPPTVTDDDLIAAVRAAGYGASLREPHRHDGNRHHQDTEPAAPSTVSLAERLTVSAVLSAPVLAISMVPAWQFDYWQFLVFLLATPVVWWVGWPFHRSAWAGLRTGRFSMDTLVSIGTLTAWGWSTWAIMFGHAAMVGMRHPWSLLPSGNDPSANLYFETAAVLVTVILLGRWLEERSRRDAGAALRELARLLPDEVRLRPAGTGSETSRPRGEVREGDEIVVLAGETIPLDGVVVEGAGSLNNALLTGEAIPVDVAPGSDALAGAIVLDGRLVIQVERTGVATRIAQIAALADAAQVEKSSVQRLADRISAVFVPFVLGLAVATGLAWWLIAGNPGLALSITIAVIIIACPCALGLATPVAILAGTGRGAQLGIILSGPRAIERARRITTVVLDKTGTLTTGELRLAELHTTGADQNEALALLAGLELGSNHPIARALSAAADEREVRPAAVTELRYEPGAGVHGTLDDQQLSAVAAHRTGIALPEALRVQTDLSTIVLLRAGQAIAVATFADTGRPDAAETVAELQRAGFRVALVSGDRAVTVQALARELDISEVAAEQSPEDKVAYVRNAKTHGPVAMVGDGINDAAALAAADLGIAIGSGTDLARAAGDITVLRSDARVIADALRLARAVRHTIIGNLIWAFGYNVAAIPLAMAGLLGPMVAGAAMALSSVFVVLNSVRLTRFR